MPWPTSWERQTVRGALEEASGEAMAVADTLPDSLITRAQELGLHPVDLHLWIYDQPKPNGWTLDGLAMWARLMRLPPPPADEPPPAPEN